MAFLKKKMSEMDANAFSIGCLPEEPTPHDFRSFVRHSNSFFTLIQKSVCGRKEEGRKKEGRKERKKGKERIE